jgi:peroxiredoxin
MAIQAGIPAPDFTLPDETGVTRRLSSYQGKPLVLYFYPKDDTPGCTTEACYFRDDYSQYEGVFRTTFLIDRQGKIVKVFENVKPAEHSAEVLDALK